MAITTLPRADSPDVQLVVATSDELRAQWHYNSAEWRGPLPLEAYIRREEHLLDQTLTRDGGLTPWLLVQQASDGTRKILCGCETINKRALVARHGQVEEVTCHGVASVFCPAEHRGKGYAGRMMSDLAVKIKDWQASQREVLFSILFSDIGKEFYATRGWQVFPSAHVSLKSAIAAGRDDLPAVKLLTAGDVESLCVADEYLLRHRLTSRKSAKTTVAVVPDLHTIDWHHARASFFARELLGRNIEHLGAMVKMQSGRRVWCFWQQNWSKIEQHKDNKLYILHIAIEDEDGEDFSAASEQGQMAIKDPACTKAIAALFAAAQAEAAAWNLSSVEYWSPTSVVMAAAQLLDADIDIQHREDSSILSLQWYGEGSWQDVDWIYDERFAWC